MDVILLHSGHQRVSANQAMFRVVKTRLHILKCAGEGLVIDLRHTLLHFTSQ